MSCPEQQHANEVKEFREVVLSPSGQAHSQFSSSELVSGDAPPLFVFGLGPRDLRPLRSIAFWVSLAGVASVLPSGKAETSRYAPWPALGDRYLVALRTDLDHGPTPKQLLDSHASCCAQKLSVESGPQI